MENLQQQLARVEALRQAEAEASAARWVHGRRGRLPRGHAHSRCAHAPSLSVHASHCGSAGLTRPLLLAAIPGPYFQVPRV